MQVAEFTCTKVQEDARKCRKAYFDGAGWARRVGWIRGAHGHVAVDNRTAGERNGEAEFHDFGWLQPVLGLQCFKKGSAVLATSSGSARNVPTAATVLARSTALVMPDLLTNALH